MSTIGSSVGGFSFKGDRSKRAGHPPLNDREKVGALMQQYHASSGDPIYAVGSYYFSNMKYPKPATVRAARGQFLTMLEDAKKSLHGWGKNEVLQIAVILSYLDHALVADYKSGEAGGDGGGYFGGGKNSWIRPGDRVKFIDARGVMRSGKVVMKSSHPGSWVLNMGGKNGTPMVVAESDIFGNATRKDPMTGRTTPHGSGEAAGRSHLLHTFEKLPVGAEFHFASETGVYSKEAGGMLMWQGAYGPWIKTGPRKYRHAHTKDGTEYTVGKISVKINYPSQRDVKSRAGKAGGDAKTKGLSAGRSKTRKVARKPAPRGKAGQCGCEKGK